MALESPPTLPRLAYSDREVAEMWGTSRSYVRTLIDSGALKSVKLGGRRLIEASAVLGAIAPDASDVVAAATRVLDDAAPIGAR